MCNKHEKNALMAFAKSKCPNCRSGKLFTHSFYNLRNFLKMNENCPVCGIKFEKETGFFWSAMYISYAINVAVAVNVGILLNIILDNPPLNLYIALIIGPVVVASTIIFRYSRMIALYTLGGHKYDKRFG